MTAPAEAAGRVELLLRREGRRRTRWLLAALLLLVADGAVFAVRVGSYDGESDAPLDALAVAFLVLLVVAVLAAVLAGQSRALRRSVRGRDWYAAPLGAATRGPWWAPLTVLGAEVATGDVRVVVLLPLAGRGLRADVAACPVGAVARTYSQWVVLTGGGRVLPIDRYGQSRPRWCLRALAEAGFPD